MFVARKCREAETAMSLHFATRKRNANARDLIKKLCKQGRLKEALHILYDTGNNCADAGVYVWLLQGCFRNKALLQGKLVHTHMNETGFTPDKLLCNTLINMYAKCGSLADARRVFDDMPEAQRDVFSWSVMISAHANLGVAQESLTLFNAMQLLCIQPNEFTFSSVLTACAKLPAIKQGTRIHQQVIRYGIQSDVFVGNALVDMYAKCGKVKKARQVFDKMPERNVVSWNAMLSGYAQNERVGEAVELFGKMQVEDVEPDARSFACILPAYAVLGSLEKGVEIHEEIVRRGFQFDVFVGSALVDMYVKCKSVDKARHVFDKLPQRNAVTWTAMIGGYTENGQSVEALRFFRRMRLSGVKPDLKTFATVLPACATLASLEQGMEIHEKIVASGRPDEFVESALIDMYVKCESIDKAQNVFDKMTRRCVVSWTSMIACYAQNGQGMEALELFHKMKVEGVKPDAKTFASVLPACASLAALEQGTDIHREIVRNGFESDVFVAGALVDMYAKCGSVEKARDVFDNMLHCDVISWTAMIAGYAMHGYAQEALKLFNQMHYSGINPNHITFICVLSACCHAGLVEKGKEYFDQMCNFFKIKPSMEHYGCMVDLLGRSGRLDEAQDFINKMPIKPNVTILCCLLGACRLYDNVDLGEQVAKQIFEMNPTNAAPYVLLSNIYARAGRWDDIEKVRNMMIERKVKKTAGHSWVEVNKQIHAFIAGDRSHPQIQEIYANLDRLLMEMKAAGYVPDTKFVLNDVEEEQKEQFLGHHSEKLAIAFGIMKACPGTIIRVIKNLRVCGDCHSAIKFISKIAARKIIVRDTIRYHHFKDGWCSCDDHW